MFKSLCPPTKVRVGVGAVVHIDFSANLVGVGVHVGIGVGVSVTNSCTHDISYSKKCNSTKLA